MRDGSGKLPAAELRSMLAGQPAERQMNNSNRDAVKATLRSVLAATYGCDEQVFGSNSVHIGSVASSLNEWRYPQPSRPLMVGSMGHGIAVSCTPERSAWMKQALGSQSYIRIFSAPVLGELARMVAREGQELIGPHMRFACSRDALRPAPTPAGLTLSVVEGAAVAALYRYPGFDNALSYRRDATRPDVLATVMRHGDEVVGIAAAGADHPLLWQIGVDVVPQLRGRGIGRALVSRLTSAILDADKLPFYSTNLAHLGSQALAQSCGYWPAWVEVCAVDRS